MAYRTHSHKRGGDNFRRDAIVGSHSGRFPLGRTAHA
jgi:hypothetical protein